MTLIEEVGASVGPIVAVFVAAALLAFILTPLVRRVVLRYRIVDRPNARRVNTRPIPRAGGLAIAAAFLVVAAVFLVLNGSAGWVPTPLTLHPGDFLALFLGGAAAAALGAIDDLFDLRARWQLAGQLALAVGAVALGIGITVVNNPFGEDVTHFHRTWQRVCDAHAPLADHAAMKAACDDYFHLPHRDEARGVGGIFFDHFGAADLDRAFDFVQDAGAQFLPSYLPIVARRKGDVFTPDQRWFQEYRRGRYVEFNLLHDRGTVFGLKTNGRTESILMSLPPTVRYEYGVRYDAGSREAELTDTWLKPRDWAAES